MSRAPYEITLGEVNIFLLSLPVQYTANDRIANLSKEYARANITIITLCGLLAYLLLSSLNITTKTTRGLIVRDWVERGRID